MRAKCSGSRLWLLAAIALGLSPQMAVAQGIHVSIKINKMHCIRPTETGSILGIGNDRDEMFILVNGKTPHASVDNRLPSEGDYYEWKEGWHDRWTNRDQKRQQPPLIWRGLLEAGQSAELLVLIREQDDDVAFGTPEGDRRRKEFSDKVAARFFADPRTKAFVVPLQDWILGKRDTIGGFTITVKNEDGKLHQTWRSGIFTSIAPNGAVPEDPQGYKKVREQNDAGLFFETVRLMDKAVEAPEVFIVAKGTNECHYNLIASVSQVPMPSVFIRRIPLETIIGRQPK